MTTTERYQRRKRERQLDKAVLQAFAIAIENLENGIKERREKEVYNKTKNTNSNPK